MAEANNIEEEMDRLSLAGPFTFNQLIDGYEFSTPEFSLGFEDANAEALAEFVELNSVGDKQPKEVGNQIPFDKLRKSMVNVTEDGKIMKKILSPGVQNVINPNTTASVHYNFYLDGHMLPFDSTSSRSDYPYKFKIGNGEVFEGFELAVLTMKKREKSQFLIDNCYAFGEMGVPPRIPPNATILAEIDLVSFTEEDDINALEQRDGFNKKVNFADIYKAAAKHTHEASTKFAQSNYYGAISCYKKAERLLLTCRMYSDEEEEKQSNLLLKIYTNLMVCYSGTKLNKPEKVCIFAREAFQAHPTKSIKNAKLFYLLGMAKLAFMDWKSANFNLNKALKLEPNNATILEGLEQVKKSSKMHYSSSKVALQEPLVYAKPQLKELPKVLQPEDLEGVPADQDFKDCFKDVLMEFMSGPKNKFTLSSGLTTSEKYFCVHLMKLYNLTVFEESEETYAVKDPTVKE